MKLIVGCLLAMGISLPSFAQDSDPRVMAAQLEQMQGELQFLRRQLDTGTREGGAFEALATRVDGFETNLSALEAKVSRLIEIDSQKSRQLEAMEQRLKDMELNLSVLASDTTTTTIVVTEPRPPEARTQADSTAESTRDNGAGAAAPLPDARIETAPVSATAIMAGALLDPGPTKPIEYSDAQGEISRPIPLHRPVEDLDPQPLTQEEFDSIVGRTRTSEASAESGVSAGASNGAANQSVSAAQTNQNNAADGTANQTPSIDANPASTPEPEPAPSTAPAQAQAQAQAQDDSATTPQASPQAPIASSDIAKERYEAAYALIESNDLTGAERGFRQFLQEYPDDPLASNASYWLGESFYARGDLNSAMRAFVASVRDYRDGRKAPDSLLKLGITLGALGQNPRACRLLEFLPEEYPGADATLLERATAETRKLNC